MTTDDNHYRPRPDQDILEFIYHRLGEIMTAINDLDTDLTNLEAVQSAVVTALNDLVAAVAASAGADDPAVESAAARVQAVADALSAAATQDDPGPQVTPPATGPTGPAAS